MTAKTMALPAPAPRRAALTLGCGLVLACLAMLLMRGLGLGGISLRNGAPHLVVDAGAPDTGTD